MGEGRGGQQVIKVALKVIKGDLPVTSEIARQAMDDVDVRKGAGQVGEVGGPGSDDVARRDPDALCSLEDVAGRSPATHLSGCAMGGGALARDWGGGKEDHNFRKQPP